MGDPQPNASRRRSWPVRAVGVLLLVQAVVLFLFIPLHVAIEVWKSPLPVWELLLSPTESIPLVRVEVSEGQSLPLKLHFKGATAEIPQDILTSQDYMLLSPAALVIAIAFIGLWRHAWTATMLLQGLVLATALGSHFDHKPIYVYPIMLYSILMVLYLNHHDVRIAFRSKTRERHRMDREVLDE